MLVIRSRASNLHNPEFYFRRGVTIAHPESIERHRVLEAAVRQAGFEVHDAMDCDDSAIEAVHDLDYLRFLRDAWAQRATIDPAAVEMLTTHFSRQQMCRRPDGLAGQLGYYTADTSTPIGADTWAAIRGSAQAAVQAAHAAHMHGRAYALCRPPGHHAFADCAAASATSTTPPSPRSVCAR